MAEYINNEAAFVAGQWDMFKLITSAYFAKEYYFDEPDGTIYSRLSGTYLKSKEDAVNEFTNYISEH